MEVAGGIDAFVTRRIKALGKEREEELSDASAQVTDGKSLSKLEDAGVKQNTSHAWCLSLSTALINRNERNNRPKKAEQTRPAKSCPEVCL